MNRSVLLDTQLMVLLAVGATSPDIIAKHKKLTSFTRDDFDLLVTLLCNATGLVLLPNTVSEASNLLRYHRDPEKSAIMAMFRDIIHNNQEFYVESAIAANRPEYKLLGIADSAILQCCAETNEILTTDLDLYLAASRCGVRVRNFNHAREEFGLA